MASCFKCEVVDKTAVPADPIGVCASCHSLSCADHGTRLRGVPEFKCVFCAPWDLKTAALRIIHETYDEPPPGGGDRGPRMPSPRDPGPGGGREVWVPAVASHEEFERSVSTARIAKLSGKHRRQAAEQLGDLLEIMERFRDREEQATMVEKLAATSDKATRARVRIAGMRSAEILALAREAELLDRELLADSIGLAAWAIGARIGRQMSVDRILLVPDAELQFLLRVTSSYLATERA